MTTRSTQASHAHCAQFALTQGQSGIKMKSGIAIKNGRAKILISGNARKKAIAAMIATSIVEARDLSIFRNDI